MDVPSSKKKYSCSRPTTDRRIVIDRSHGSWMGAASCRACSTSHMTMKPFLRPRVRIQRHWFQNAVGTLAFGLLGRAAVESPTVGSLRANSGPCRQSWSSHEDSVRVDNHRARCIRVCTCCLRTCATVLVKYLLTEMTLSARPTMSVRLANRSRLAYRSRRSTHAREALPKTPRTPNSTIDDVERIS